jgi:hypothetical protein
MHRSRRPAAKVVNRLTNFLGEVSNERRLEEHQQTGGRQQDHIESHASPHPSTINIRVHLCLTLPDFFRKSILSIQELTSLNFGVLPRRVL